MTMVDAARSDEIYAEMGPATEASGGSAANTAAGVASFGGKAAYIGRVADDTFGKVFAHDLRSLGVHFDTPLATSGSPTGRCLVIVTPDAQRTMCTFLGAGAELDESYVDEALDRERGGHLPRGLHLGSARGEGRRAAGRRDRAPRRPTRRAHALGSVLRRAAPRRVPRADRRRHRHPLRQRARDHDALRGRHVRRGACTTCAGTARSRRSPAVRTAR